MCYVLTDCVRVLFMCVTLGLLSRLVLLAHLADLALVHAEKVHAVDAARRELRIRDLLLEVVPGDLCLLLGSTIAALAEKTLSNDPLLDWQPAVLCEVFIERAAAAGLFVLTCGVEGGSLARLVRGLRPLEPIGPPSPILHHPFEPLQLLRLAFDRLHFTIVVRLADVASHRVLGPWTHDPALTVLIAIIARRLGHQQA